MLVAAPPSPPADDDFQPVLRRNGSEPSAARPSATAKTDAAAATTVAITANARDALQVRSAAVGARHQQPVGRHRHDGLAPTAVGGWGDGSGRGGVGRGERGDAPRGGRHREHRVQQTRGVRAGPSRQQKLPPHLQRHRRMRETGGCGRPHGGD